MMGLQEAFMQAWADFRSSLRGWEKGLFGMHSPSVLQAHKYSPSKPLESLSEITHFKNNTINCIYAIKNKVDIKI
jgi:hypothetical protein